MTPPRVRFAPSPTGYLHVGGARTALFNWLYARKTGGMFVLRIEDTDRERSTDEHTRTILDGITWLGIAWDEGPVHQGDGLRATRPTPSACWPRARPTAASAPPRSSPPSAPRAEARARVPLRPRAATTPRGERAPRGRGRAVHRALPRPRGRDRVGRRGARRDQLPDASLDDFIILRSDGTPIYNLAVVSDDIDMRITHVMRGDDHISNTPKQILLYQALGRPPRCSRTCP